MTLDAFKLLFADRPEAPEGVEFWEWRPMPETMRENAIDSALRIKLTSWRLRPGSPGAAVVQLWPAGGPPDTIIVRWTRGRVVYYHTKREGALTS